MFLLVIELYKTLKMRNHCAKKYKKNQKCTITVQNVSKKIKNAQNFKNIVHFYDLYTNNV